MQKWSKIIFLLVFVSIITSDFAFAQKTPVRNDSTHLYKNIEKYSKRSKYTKFVYPLIFKSVVTRLPKKKEYKKLIKKPYSAYEGKIIRHINIETLDPFGIAIADTLVKAHNFLPKTGNKLHVKTLHITIRNLVLIRQNQPFDSLLVKESERLVRRQAYVRDVAFTVKSVSATSDSVDIYIREMDNWSLIPGGAASSSSISLNIRERNFSGLGHEMQNGITWNHSAGTYAYTGNYFIPNIRNTYINSTVHYGKEESGNLTKIFAVDRPFFSPFAKWAAGVSFEQLYRLDYLRGNDSILMPQHFKFNVQDYWAGYARQIFKGKSENDRATNFISALRFLRIRYLENPGEEYDKQHFFYD